MPNCTSLESQRLNTCCAPGTLRRDKLNALLAADLAAQGASQLERTHPGLFANERVYLGAGELQQMQDTISAVEKIRRTPVYLGEVLRNADPVCTPDPGTKGVFGSYDFHITPDGPALIEINTNAGGALLAAAAARSHELCCDPFTPSDDASDTMAFGTTVANMFLREWQASGRNGTPSVIAIVDDEPETQFLHPEFLIVKRLLERQGMTALILDPFELQFDGTRLLGRNRPIDIVYNRLTDFYLEAPRNAALRKTALAGAALITPHPFHHAVLAQKTNLVRLGDPDILADAPLSAAEREALARIPETRLLTRDTAETLWKQRKSLYFKPVAGHAAKGVYRGAKITTSAWEQIKSGGYIAQRAATPSQRLVTVQGTGHALKTDFRLYTYGGETLLVAARLYQGQTTNMRTPGGGFAPVVIV